MKYVKPVSLIILGFLLGLAPASLQRSKNTETESTDTLRASLEQAETAAKTALLQRDRFKAESDQLRASTQEIHRLRAEISQLSQELTERKMAQEQMARAAKKVESPHEMPAKSKGADGSAIAIESAPFAVQTAISREFAGGPITGVLGSSIDKTGRMTFGFKGQTPDQRAVAIRLAEDGAILERSAEIPTETLPANIQAKAAELFETLPISAAREIVDGENLTYELSAKGPDSGMQAMVRNDGTIISYSAKWRQPERVQEKQKR